MAKWLARLWCTILAVAMVRFIYIAYVIYPKTVGMYLIICTVGIITYWAVMELRNEN